MICRNCGHGLRIRSASFHSQSNLALSRIRSDYVPSDMEKLVLQDTIREARSNVDVLDREIHQVQGLLSQLFAQKQEIESFVDGQRSLLSPIRRVPAEVLGEIFLYSCPIIEIGNWRGNSLAWRLGEVCVYWRKLVMSLHELWATMDITMQAYMARPQEYPGYMRSINHLVDTCLLRSGDSPLSFSLATHGTHPSFSTVFEKLFVQSSRWRNVSLEVDWLTFLPNLAQIRYRIPRLRSLTLKARIGTGHYIHPIDAFEVAPRLSRLEIENFPYPVFRLKVPWFQLTHYKSTSSSHGPGEFCEILRRMPNLTRFESSQDRGLPGQGDEALWLPRLRELAVRVPSFYLSNILDPLISPLLTTFRLSGADSTDNFRPEPILSFFRRSPSNLRSLTLSSISVDYVFQILAECHTVEVIRVGFLDYAQNLLRKLVWRGHGIPFLSPKLHTFILSYCHDGTNLVEELVDLIRSRLTARPCNGNCSGEGYCSTSRLRFVQINLRCAVNRPNAFELIQFEQFRDINGFELVIEV